MASTWALGWDSTCDEVVYPGELPVGLSTLLSRGPRSLSAAHWRPGVEPPRTCSPSSPTQALSKGTSVPWSSSPIPVNRHGAQHTPGVRPPFTFCCILRPGFQFSPRARAGPRAAVVEDEGFGLPGVLVMLRTLSYSSQILATWSVATSLRPRPNKCARLPPTSHVAHAGSQNEVIAGRGAAFWPGTRPLQLLTVTKYKCTFKLHCELFSRIFCYIPIWLVGNICDGAELYTFENSELLQILYTHVYIHCEKYLLTIST
jgi:hypothetical protein